MPTLKRNPEVFNSNSAVFPTVSSLSHVWSRVEYNIIKTIKLMPEAKKNCKSFDNPLIAHEKGLILKVLVLLVCYITILTSRKG